MNEKRMAANIENFPHQLYIDHFLINKLNPYNPKGISKARKSSHFGIKCLIF